jgi:hypothetical protein
MIDLIGRDWLPSWGVPLWNVGAVVAAWDPTRAIALSAILLAIFVAFKIHRHRRWVRAGRPMVRMTMADGTVHVLPHKTLPEEEALREDRHRSVIP